MRRDAKLQPNSFVQLRKQSGQHNRTIRLDDLGSADAVLTNKEHLRRALHSLSGHGVIPKNSGLSGWLGKYEAALVQTAMELAQHEAVLRTGPTREVGRG